MMKKNKLYTINKRRAEIINRPAFMPKDENLFAGPFGSSQMNQPFQFSGFTPKAQAAIDKGIAASLPKAGGGIGGLLGGLGDKLGGVMGGGKLAGSPMGGLIGGLGSAVGGLANNLISGDYKSGAGSAISGIGSTVGSAISNVNPVLGGIVSVGSGIIGGAVNALFGQSVDEEALKQANEGTAAYNNFTSNAGTFDEIKGPEAQANVRDVYKDGLFGGDADEKNEALRQQRRDARQWADRSIGNNIFNLQQDQVNNAMRNFKAFGGLTRPKKHKFDMGGFTYNPFELYGGYGSLDDFHQAQADNTVHSGVYAASGGSLTMPKKRKFNGGGFIGGLLGLNTSENLPSLEEQYQMYGQGLLMPGESNVQGYQGGPSAFGGMYANGGRLFDIGGDLQTHGADFSTGLSHINAGGSHEENPNDGVQMGVDPEGTPNLVEEGETIWNDYVFSNRILADETTKQMFHLPKKRDITFADISKKFEKEIAERPNDPISKAGFKSQMQTLEEQQERQKQEMEAERAKEAFEALSPEEQTAVMQNVAQQEQMAQQAAQEQAIAEQQAMQQATPEELAMAQQAQQQADGTQAMIGQEAPMMAEGGHLFKGGGKVYENIFKALGFNTMGEFKKWAKDNKVVYDDPTYWDSIDEPESLGWDAIMQDPNFRKAISKDNPALAHALSKNYDFGKFVPDNTGNVTFKDINKGNWTAQDYEGWKDSQDPAWLEAVEKSLVREGMNQEEIAKALKQTDSYKRGSKWLQDSEDNRLRYLRTILEDEYSPEVAKNYARKYIDNNGWKQGVARDYNTIFGTDGKGVRETHPGTYWHTPIEAVRGQQAQNFVINEDGTVEPIVGDVPTDWASAGNYSWATPENDLTYNYYRRPAAAASTSPKTPVAKTPEEEGPGIEPAKKADWMRYAGLFGPAVGLGMQMAGVGRPDTASLDAAISGAGNVYTADYQPIGNYLTYRPLDIWYEQNRANALSRATDRNIMNTSGGNRGTAMAGLIANGYNSQLASGNLFRQAEESNLAQRERVEAFNRGTNQFNAEAYNRNSQFNADARNRANQYAKQLALHAASQKMNADAGWYNGIYGNVAGLFKGLSDLGRENRETNWRNALVTSGAFGTMDEDALVDAGIAKYKRGKKSAEGGIVKRKKGKRGLTY